MLKNTHTNFWHTCRSFLLPPLPNSTWSITGNCKWQKIRTHAFDIVVFGSFVRPPLLNSTWLKRNGKLQVTKVYYSIDPWVCKFWKCCSYFGLYTHLPLLRVRVWVIWDGHCSYGLVWLVLCHHCSWLWCLTALPHYYHIMSSLHITMCTHYNMYQLYCVNTLHRNITTNNYNDLLIWYFRAWRDSRAIQTCWLELQEYMRLEYCSLLKTSPQLGLLFKNSWVP